MDTVLPDTLAVMRGCVELTEYAPLPPTTVTAPVEPQASVMLDGVALIATTGGFVPFTVVIGMITRAPVASWITHCSSVRQFCPAPTTNVKRPGCVVEGEPFTWICGFGQVAVYGAWPSKTRTSTLPKPHVVALGPVRLIASGMTASVPVAGVPMIGIDRYV